MKAEGRGRSFRRLSRTWYLGCSLLDAMKYGRWEDVRALTKLRDLDPNVLIPEYGIAPMHCAAGIEPEEFGLKCVREFLNIGGDPNVTCSEGVTPVHVACCWGRAQVLRYLLKRGGDPYLMDEDGNDALYYAGDKEKINRLLTNFGQNKQKNCQGGDILTPTEPHMINCSVEESEDLDLNLKAYSLILKHRKSVFIYENYPDDELSTITLKDDGVEDFAYSPEVDKTSVFIGYKGQNIVPDVGRLETWTNNSDQEICTENILEADKTHVIKVINENINNSLSASSLADSVRPMSEKSVRRRSRKSETSIDRSISNYEQAPSPPERYYSPLIDETSTISVVKSEDKLEGLDYVNVHPDQSWKYIGYPTNFDNNDYDSDNKYKDKGPESEKPDVNDNGSSTNILGISKWSDKTNRTISKDSIYLKKKLSKSSCSSMISVSEDTNYRSPLESNDLEKVIRISSHESTTSINSNFKLPKNLRDTLKKFKVNTHYRSRTRILRMTSKSCDGFKIKKSLYCTGYEFWSSKVRSRSYPSSAHKRVKEE